MCDAVTLMGAGDVVDRVDHVFRELVRHGTEPNG
jgi:hypothetical protein